ncbi:MAG TPA: hypothetical protein VGX95_04310 [Xanthobacteraceae bacterium]|jgi:hypothetical protein|nr:hypothetical protein [Xanthobacteraceae bacterium]
MGDGFRLRFATYMTPWTQDCMFFVILTLSQDGVGVAPDPRKQGFGMEEQWFARWSDVMSLQQVRPPEPIVRIEFPTSVGQTAIRDIRVPKVADGPFAGCEGPRLVEAMLLAWQEHHRAPSVEEVMRRMG